jgi:hypothetical protein
MATDSAPSATAPPAPTSPDYFAVWKHFQERGAQARESLVKVVTWNLGFASVLLAYLIDKTVAVWGTSRLSDHPANYGTRRLPERTGSHSFCVGHAPGLRASHRQPVRSGGSHPQGASLVSVPSWNRHAPRSRSIQRSPVVRSPRCAGSVLYNRLWPRSGSSVPSAPLADASGDAAVAMGNNHRMTGIALAPSDRSACT